MLEGNFSPLDLVPLPLTHGHILAMCLFYFDNSMSVNKIIVLPTETHRNQSANQCKPSQTTGNYHADQRTKQKTGRKPLKPLPDSDLTRGNQQKLAQTNGNRSLLIPSPNSDLVKSIATGRVWLRSVVLAERPAIIRQAFFNSRSSWSK